MSVADFLREAEALRRLASKEEREAIRRTAGLGDAFRDIHDQTNSRLRADVMSIQQRLQKLGNDVFRFQQQLMDVRASPDVVDQLKDTMTDIENSIGAFKDAQHQRFEELLKDERATWQEISAFERKVDVWSLPVKADRRLPCARSDKLSTERRNLPPEVTALETFLQQTGGRWGGWDEYDHQSFIKVWRKHSGKPSYRHEAKLYLPSRTEEEVQQHEEWHLELRRLQERKREAIHRWRVAKQRERELQREQQETRTELQEDEEAQRLKQEERRKEASERLEAWRSQREMQREQERQQRLRDEILHRRRAKEERRRQLEVKLTVEAHVRQKREDEELRLLEKESQEQAEREERHRQAAEAIKRFQERDSLLIEVKQQEKQSKEEEWRERQRTLVKLKEKAEQHIARDPARLWRPTKVWQERTKEIGPSGAAPLMQIFRRAVPTWRQDL